MDFINSKDIGEYYENEEAKDKINQTKELVEQFYSTGKRFSRNVQNRFRITQVITIQKLHAQIPQNVGALPFLLLLLRLFHHLSWVRPWHLVQGGKQTG